MKLLYLEQWGDWDNVISVLFVGNEYSPDPVDMMQRIQAQYPENRTKGKRLTVQANNDLYKEKEDIRRLLNKNGYTEFVPNSVLICRSLNE